MTATRTASAPAPVTSGRPTLPRLMRSEWIKLRTLRSTVWCFALILLVFVGFSAMFAPPIAGQMGEQLALGREPATPLLLRFTLTFSIFGMLVAGVLGVLTISGEYSTGMIRSTFSAAPRRLGALVAKGIVFTVVTFIVSAVAVVAAVLVGQAFFIDVGAKIDIATGEAFTAMLGATLFIVLIGLMGFAFGMLLRNGAAGIGALMGLVLVLPLIASILGAVLPWVSDLLEYLPFNAGMRLYSLPSGSPDELEFWQALLVMVGWVAVILVPALILARKRDA
ncbi:MULTISPECIES: ABC transporter permease subunit [Clavibacter]|uniref:ABC transporter permease n=1 Tax=Clavibacter tessellarius TaxID=31965 RepID=A0A154V2B3_9MICO|nr:MULTISPECIES: ABC transporter permease subunit [Clavibacter]KZC95457.1 ABC transporter permease [Clavibacter michiganensis subsp. tessellarius]MDA3803593.1 ABC transporter permease subunit [Clavibacter sp. CT19]